MSLKFDKTGWKRVALGEVAGASKDKVDPSDGNVERFVAGEHMDTDELQIHRWGVTSDVDLGPAFHRRFRPGQVLYGSRRTYLRKVAVAEFDGVCANTTFVVDTKDHDVLLQEFLPFIMSSEPFHAFAIAESKGSVNPYVNWSDIERFELDLPFVDEQRRIADLLWAIERHRVARRRVELSLHAARSAAVTARLGDEGKRERLEQLIRVGTTITYGIVQAGPEVDGGVPYIRVSDMTGGHLAIDGMKRTDPSIAEKFERSRVDSGDLVVALRGRTGLTLRVPEELDGANLTQGTARVAIDGDQVTSDYVLAVMNSEWMAKEINRQAKGSTFTELTLVALRALPILRLGAVAEAKLVSDLQQIDAALADVARSTRDLDDVRSRILAQVFGDK